MTSSTSRLTIEERIQALAQELQDQILEHTLIAGVEHRGVVAITKSYKPPWQLSINRITRKSVAQAYYGATIFQIDIDGDWLEVYQKVMSTAKKWLASLPEHERSGISQLRFNRYEPSLPACSELIKQMYLTYQETWFQICSTLPLDRRCIKSDVTLRYTDGSRTTHWVDWDGFNALLEAEDRDRV